MESSHDIYRRIPHRPPFLWVDRIIRLEGGSIETEKKIPTDLDIFRGHYPDYPIMPGVLLCEAIFQTGALLIGELLSTKETAGPTIPVLSRINNAKFKREVLPGDTIRMEVIFKESVGAAWFFRGKAFVGSQVAVTVDFACMVKDAKSADNR